jgi:hypothetical protein
VDDRVKPAVQRAAQDGRIGDVADDDVDVGVRMRLEVDDPDLGAVVCKCGHDVATDEAGSTGHEHAPILQVR